MIVVFLYQVTRAVLDSGQALAAQTKDSSPMMFQWHNKKYLGAAHGMAGILYTLLLVCILISFTTSLRVP